MAATFTWKVLDMAVENRLIDNHNDIVSTIYWECSGVQEDGANTYSATVCRNTVIPYIAETWVPYADLTQNTVLGWVFAANGVKANTETELQTNIDLQMTPSVIYNQLPWISVTSDPPPSDPPPSDPPP